MDTDRTQLIDRLRQANNVLITVNSNPTVDQLAACIGVTLLLNKVGKHATAVYSGNTPSTLEFLKPEETIEKTTDSLRDFIISLDKSKADKLRYKVEDKLVKIFITPYKTSISDADLEFSQGDFNVDVVLALGIHEREQVDAAIASHGRILHDAVVMSVNVQSGNNLGTINWVGEHASSLSEMLAGIADELQPQSVDAQIATAFLTGIVSETNRFSNDKTSSQTMSVSSMLMAAGADQQLVATKLEPQKQPIKQEDEQEESQDGAIVIEHTEADEKAEQDKKDTTNSEEELSGQEVSIDENGELKTASNISEAAKEDDTKTEEPASPSSRVVSEPPTLGGTLTANSNPEPLDPSTDPLSMIQNDKPVLSHQADEESPQRTVSSVSSVADVMSSSKDNPLTDGKTLEEIESELKTSKDDVGVDSNVDLPEPVANLDNARDAVSSAINSNPDSERPKPIAGLNAQPIDLNASPSTPMSGAPDTGAPTINPSTGQAQDMSGDALQAESPLSDQQATDVNLPEPPPPVPPPLMPPFDSSSTPSPQ